VSDTPSTAICSGLPISGNPAHPARMDGNASLRTPEFEARHRASAVISRMMLIVCRSMLEGYSRDRNIAAAFPEMLITMAIRDNDDQGLPPISVSAIARQTGLPRASVQRWLARLTQHRVIKKSDEGCVGDDRFLEARLDAKYFERIVAAIRLAARQLGDDARS